MFNNWILHRLREPSTWAGIITLVSGLLGWKLSEEVRAHVITIGMSVVGLLLAIGREGKPTDEDPPLVPPILPPIKQPDGATADGATDHPTSEHDRGVPGDPNSGLRSDAGRADSHRGVKDRWLHRRDPDR